MMAWGRSKKQTEQTEDNGFAQAWEEDPLNVLVTLVASTPSPLVTLALLVLGLRHADLVTEEELEGIGLSSDELEVLLADVSEAEDVGLAEQGLRVRAALRLYQRQVDTIIEVEGWVLSQEARKELASMLAKFAKDNDLTDLTVAHRLIKAEQPELLAAYRTSL